MIFPGTYDLLPAGLVGRALRFVLPRAERWRGVVHRVVGRRQAAQPPTPTPQRPGARVVAAPTG